VLRDGGRGDIIGYGGLWKVSDEAHITTIGVRAESQHQGLGTGMFAALVQRSYELGARWITLEVRVTNGHAIRLYERFGFKAIGRRRGYYTDNGEDAVVNVERLAPRAVLQAPVRRHPPGHRHRGHGAPAPL